MSSSWQAAAADALHRLLHQLDFTAASADGLILRHDGYLLLLVLLLIPLLLLLARQRHRLLALYRTAGRDAFYHFAGFGRPTAAAAAAAAAAANDDDNVVAIFESVAASRPDKACFVADAEVWTFRLVAELVDRLASYLRRRLPPGSALGVLGLRPSPLHAALWLGAAKAGCFAVLMDATGDALDSDAALRRRRLRRLAAVAYEADAEASLLALLPWLRRRPEPPPLLLCCRSADAAGDAAEGAASRPPPRLPGAVRLEAELAAAEAAAAADEDDIDGDDGAEPRTRPGPHTPLLAVTEAGRQLVVTHARYRQLAAVPHRLLELGREDVLYVCQPMHTALATVAGVGLAVLEGGTCVLRGDCSAAGYWTDCARFGCTAGLYDRQLARELLRRRRRPSDRLHSVLTLLGCGMPAAIGGGTAARARGWTAPLLDRFRLVQVGELGGCESAAFPAFLANTESRPGAVGFVPLWLPRLAPLRLLRVSPTTGLPVRDAVSGGGFCLPARPGDTALALLPAGPAEPLDAWPNRLAGLFRPGDAYWHGAGLLVLGPDGDLMPARGPDQRSYWMPNGAAYAEMQSILSSILPECPSCTVSCIAAALSPGVSNDDEGAAEAVALAEHRDSSPTAVGEVEYAWPSPAAQLPDGAEALPARLRRGLEARLPSYARPRIVRVSYCRRCDAEKADDGASGLPELLAAYEVCPDTGRLLPLSGAEHRLLLRDLARHCKDRA